MIFKLIVLVCLASLVHDCSAKTVPKARPSPERTRNADSEMLANELVQHIMDTEFDKVMGAELANVMSGTSVFPTDVSRDEAKQLFLGALINIGVKAIPWIVRGARVAAKVAPKAAKVVKAGVGIANAISSATNSGPRSSGNPGEGLSSNDINAALREAALDHLQTMAADHVLSGDSENLSFIDTIATTIAGLFEPGKTEGLTEKALSGETATKLGLAALIFGTPLKEEDGVTNSGVDSKDLAGFMGGFHGGFRGGFPGGFHGGFHGGFNGGFNRGFDGFRAPFNGFNFFGPRFNDFDDFRFPFRFRHRFPSFNSDDSTLKALATAIESSDTNGI